MTAVAVRSVGWLDKHGYLRSEGEEDAAENADTDSPWMRCLQGSLGVGELQRWAEHGRSEKKSDPAQGHPLPKPKGLGAEHLKFNLHAGVSVPAGLPAARERLLRYCARPPLALERLSVLEDGTICDRFKDSEKVRFMTPTQFMARIAALVPPPRHPLVRFYGAWAPHHRWRSRVVTATPLMKRSPCFDPSAAPVRGDGGPVADDETPPAPQRAESRQRARRSARTPSPRPRQPRPCLEPSRRLSLRRTTRPRSYGS